MAKNLSLRDDGVRPLKHSLDLWDGSKWDAASLQSRLDADGYLFVPGLLPQGVSRSLGEKCVDVIKKAGWLAGGQQAGRQPRPGFWTSHREKLYDDTLDKTALIPEYHTLPHDKDVLAFFSSLFGKAPFLLPNYAASAYFPVTPDRLDMTTAQHQEFFAMPASRQMLVLWTPLHTCPLPEGPLLVAEGSHKNGMWPLKLHLTEFGGVQTDGDFSGSWRGSDMNAGDALIFSCFTVHKALRNISDNIRLSMSYKIQPEGEPVSDTSAANLMRHRPSGQPWAKIYEAGVPVENQYYWQRLSHTVVPRDWSLTRTSYELAIDEAGRGNFAAMGLLRSIVKTKLFDDLIAPAHRLIGEFEQQLHRAGLR